MFLRFYKTLAILLLLLSGDYVHADGFTERAKKLVRAVNVFNGSPTEFCEDDSKNTPAPISISSIKLTSETQQGLSKKYKSDGDLIRYIDCYLDNDARMKLVLDSYLPMIDAAAKHFQIPKTLLACLLFRESKFNVNAISPGKAVGIGQHLEVNVNYLSGVIKYQSPENAKNYGDAARRTPQEQRTARKNQITLEVAEGEITQAKSKTKNYGHMVRWDAYFQELASRKLHDGAVPRSLNMSNIKNPQIAIGTAALYVRDMLIHFKSALDASIHVDMDAGQTQNTDLLLAAAGAYNMGPGGKSQGPGKPETGAYRILKPVANKGYDVWVQALIESNLETSRHVLSIKRCIEPANSKSGNPWGPPMASHPRDCLDESGEFKATGKYKQGEEKDDVSPELMRKFSASEKISAASMSSKPKVQSSKPQDATAPPKKRASPKPAPAPKPAPKKGKGK